MIERIVDFSVKNRFLVILFVLFVGAMGVRAMQLLPMDAVPDVTNVQVQILTNAPSLGPTEVEQFITFPIESAMGGLPHLSEVRSVSRFGVSAVTLVFEEGTSIYFARQLVQERLSEARNRVPKEYGRPEMGPISSGLGEVYQFEVRGDPTCSGEDTDDCYTVMELRTILDWYIAYQLRSVDGVVEINSFGGELKTYEVQVDPIFLRAFDLGLEHVFEALEQNNVSAGGGYIAHAGEQRLIRARGLITNLDDIRRVVVATRDDGTPVRIADIATVEHAPMIRQGAVTRDGRGEVVTGIVMMLMGANSRAVSEAVERRIEEIRPTLPPGVSIDTFYNRTHLVDRTVKTAATNLIEGGVLVIIVLLLLLGNLRGGLLVASVIPLSMLAAFIGMRALGVSGNLMSLGALDFGIIVDGPVVIVEHILLLLSRARTGSTPEMVRTASRPMARPVVFAVGIIMLVYLPILTLQGIEGKMFQPMALTVLLALGASVILALTLMPAMSTFLFRKEVSENETWLMRTLRRIYEPLLDRAFQRGSMTVGFALLFLVGAILLVPSLGAVFLPRLDEGAIAMQAVRLPSVSLEQSIDATTRVESTLLREFPTQVETVVSRTGRAEIATDPMGVEMSDVFIMLHPPNQWNEPESKEQLVARMKATLEHQQPGQNYLFSQPIELRTNELISGVRSDIAVQIYGEDLGMLGRVGDDIVRTAKRIDGTADVSMELIGGLPFLDVDVDRDAMARYGVSARQVADAVSVVAGRQVGTVFEGQRRFPLQVRIPEGMRNNIDVVRDLPVRARAGGTVPLGQLAHIVQTEGPAQISRENVQRRATVQINVRGRDIAGYVAEAQQRIQDEVEIPPGHFIHWGGQFENLQMATRRLAIVVPATLLLIFLLLFMNFGSARPAWIVYLNVPFAATGGIVALFLRDMPFSISAAVGFIALFGIAVLNGVVLVSTIRDFQSSGMCLSIASLRGTKARLRPVLMTAVTDALGFLPMAISSSAGAEVQRPLATVVIGGLVSCTLLTLFVLPVVYGWFGGQVKSNHKARVETTP